ncbi:hypothetical protein FO519_009936 [Halicephalobus sp. NKZ332]|nr:hypothetical protein FO519_009936 [Halicephalobus sp. NKZ332]
MSSTIVGNKDTEAIPTVSASVSLDSGDIVTYSITYEWTFFKKPKETPTCPASSSNNSRCVCRYHWRHIFHGLNLCIFTENSNLRTCYFFGIILALVASVIVTSMTFGEYMDRQTATLMTIRQKRDLRFPNITLCPKYPDAFNVSLVLSDIQEKLSVNVEINNTDVENLLAFALGGAGLDNFKPFVNRWNDEYIDRLTIWFRKWQSNRNLPDFYSFLFEEAGYKCKDFFEKCYYAGDEIPCCDIFRFSYVMLRGRCLKLREFFQEDPAATGTLIPQIILYVSDEFPDVPTFPRFYLAPNHLNQLHLERRITSMLPDNPHCSNSSSAIGVGTCMVNTWLDRRIVNPLNCTVFYLRNKHPELPVCSPKEIVKNYNNMINLAFSNGTQCLPACFRRETKLVMQETKVVTYLLEDASQNVFHLEFAFDALQETMFQEVTTTTVPGFIAEISGQFGLFLGICIFSMAHFVLLIGLGISYFWESCFRKSET